MYISVVIYPENEEGGLLSLFKSCTLEEMAVVVVVVVV